MICRGISLNLMKACGFCWILLDSPGFRWILLDFLGFAWIWIRLDSFGLSWIISQVCNVSIKMWGQHPVGGNVGVSRDCQMLIYIKEKKERSHAVGDMKGDKEDEGWWKGMNRDEMRWRRMKGWREMTRHTSRWEGWNGIMREVKCVERLWR